MVRVQLEASSARLASPEDSSPFPSVLSFPVSLFVTRKENLSPVSPVRGWRKTASPGGVRDAEWAPVAVSSLRPNPPRSQAPLKPTRGKAVPKPLISTYDTSTKFPTQASLTQPQQSTATPRESAGPLDKARHLVTWPAASKQRPLSLRARREGPLCGPKSGYPTNFT